MAKTLVIAEKPSLGRSIASGLTWWKNEQFTRQGKDRNTWLESQNYIVASSGEKTFLDDGTASVLSRQLEF